ncbi:hypothetical protein FACS1894189_9320 [Planctomycetales bacterium]|nr:hypothetical protein FACS1894189_9320 [Planctomycetales bacterium]
MQKPTGGNGGTDDHEEKTATEDPNLEYSKKVTNLVLEYLEDQLKNKPDPELLNKLGWNEEQLRNFYAKWRKMAEQSRKPENQSGDNADAWKEAFKSLGLTPAADRQTTQKSQTKIQDDKHVTESQRFDPPSAVKDKFKRYTERISK